MAERTVIDLSNQDINSVPDSQLLDKGDEVEIRITGMLSGEDKNNLPYIMFFYDVPENPNVDEISDFVGLPSTVREERDNVKNRRRLKAIGEFFGIDWSQPQQIDDVKGLRGFAIVGLNKERTQNTVAEYLRK